MHRSPHADALPVLRDATKEQPFALRGNAFLALARAQKIFQPSTAGRANIVTDVTTGRNAVGKFGWKSQVPNLLEFSADASPDQRNYRVNCDRVVRELPDYHPRWKVAQGIDEVYQAISESGFSSDDFEGPRYNRIAFLRKLLADERLAPDLRWAGRLDAAAD